MNGTEWFVWWENGQRHVIMFPYWGYGIIVGAFLVWAFFRVTK